MALAKLADHSGAAIALLPPITVGEVLPVEMISAAKSHKDRTELSEVTGFSRFKHYEKYRDLQVAGQEEKNLITRSGTSR